MRSYRRTRTPLTFRSARPRNLNRSRVTTSSNSRLLDPMNTLPIGVAISLMPRVRSDSVRRGDGNELTSSGHPVQVWGVNTLSRMVS